ncbi:hypothetical protein FAM18113_02880 [Lacticaseibacillus paracasei]|jgi:hypothetical protein|nr:hypothetical protein FAM18113_02880 [Lacticaseibacillus paracasei]
MKSAQKITLKRSHLEKAYVGILEIEQLCQFCLKKSLFIAEFCVS